MLKPLKCNDSIETTTAVGFNVETTTVVGFNVGDNVGGSIASGFNKLHNVSHV